MKKFNSKIFIDGGDPQETEKAKKMLGYLDGQTTNPTLIAKNLSSKFKAQSSNHVQSIKLTQEMALEEYKRIVQQMSKTIPNGSVSIQVFANQESTPTEILEQARIRNKWIPNASIKIPCTKAGLSAAQKACEEMPLNITLVFSQSQAAAVYEATKAAKYPVFLSPFVGRLDDRGECGMDTIKNILQLFKNSDHHVQVLTASVRSMNHLNYGLWLKSDIITIPFKVFEQWAALEFPVPEEKYIYDRSNLKPIEYRADVVLGKKWDTYDLKHDLTDKGVTAFWNDWMGLFG
jgi:transaldolase